MAAKSKGKLIVIEGTDGSGKSTQISLLKSYLEKAGHPIELISFPRHRESFHGKTISRYLRGDFGEIGSVNPYLVSLAYAMDRAAAKREMSKWLKEGKIILADRYATSNMAHQGAKLPGPEREKFLKWDEELEYKINKIPKEDVVVYLHVPAQIGRVLAEKRGKLDIHEKDSEFLAKSEEMYNFLSKKYKHWVKINCVDKEGMLRSKTDIHKEIVKTLLARKIL